MKRITFAEPYTEKWLKEFAQALACDSFKFTPAKNPVKPSDVVTPDTRYSSARKQKKLSDKQQNILFLAQQLGR